MNGEPLNMSMIRRCTTSMSPFWVTLLGFTLTSGHAHAGGPLHKKQVVYVAQAPTAATAQAPVLYTAQAPVVYTAQAPFGYHGHAPMTYAAQAPVGYVAQAPAAYTAQAPATYVMSTGAAPTTTVATTAAAPGVGNSPTDPGIRISSAVRNALAADLVAFYHGADSGETRLDKIRSLRDRADEGYKDLLSGEDDPDLNARERDDLKLIIDWVITGGTAGAQRTYYPPFAAAPGTVPGGPGYGYGQPGGMVPQPTTYWVPIYARPQHPIHKLLHIP